MIVLLKLALFSLTALEITIITKYLLDGLFSAPLEYLVPALYELIFLPVSVSNLVQHTTILQHTLNHSGR